MSDALTLPLLPASEATSIPPVLPLCVRELRLCLDGKTILDDISLSLGAVGCTVIMGPNGAGKSLLLKLLHGLMPPSSGCIAWGGQAPERVKARQAMVFQKPVLLRRSVAANIDFVLRARGKDLSRRIELLEHVGLLHKAEQPARLLSGGEAQRLALARALAIDPEVMFLDEPTASLDPASVVAIERIVREACARGIRIIFVTHDVGQARRIADDVIFLFGGRVAEHGAAAGFFDRPQSGVARAYLNGRIFV